MLSRKFCLTALLLLSTPVLAQDKSITFTVSGTPKKTVNLLNGTSVSISTAGNLVAQCVPDANQNCADLGSGSTPPGNAPSVSLQATGFSSAPDVNGAYSAGTVVTLTSAVTGADLCTKLTAGTLAPTWNGTITSGLSGTFAVTLPTASSNYGFSLKCWGSGGSTTSAAVNVSTNAGGGGGGGTPLGCENKNTAEQAGFVRSTLRTWEQFGGGAFPNFTYYLSQAHNGFGLVYLSATRNQYTSIEFTTPNESWTGNSFQWALSQLGTNSPSAPSLNSAYVTISRCPGDFRFNIDPLEEATDSQKCKGLRWDPNTNQMKPYSSIFYTEDGVSGTTCGLAPGTKYYLNYINADPSDGIQSGEHTCGGTTCGFQFKIL